MTVTRLPISWHHRVCAVRRPGEAVLLADARPGIGPGATPAPDRRADLVHHWLEGRGHLATPTKVDVEAVAIHAQTIATEAA
jgi:hypothetical protein